MIPPCLPRRSIIEFYEESISKVCARIVSLQNDMNTCPKRLRPEIVDKLHIYEDILDDLYVALRLLS